ncbi:MAG: hypothetical protein ACRBCK_01420 [Alphaproteobacteria bacterium]
MLNTVYKKCRTVCFDKASPLSKSFVSCICFTVAFSFGTAWSYDIYEADSRTLRNVSREALSYVPSSPVVDDCIPLLKSHTHNNPSDLTTGRNQRTAGKIVALSMLLGARYAHEPKGEKFDVNSIKSVNYRHKDKKVSDDRSALAIVAYRQCQKDRILGQVALK